MVFKQPKYLIRKDLDNIKKRLLINNKNLPIKEKIVITNKPDGLLTKIDFDYNGLIKISNTYDEVVIQNYNNKHFSFEGSGSTYLQLLLFCRKLVSLLHLHVSTGDEGDAVYPTVLLVDILG